MGTVFVTGLVCLAAVAAVRSMIRHKTDGKSLHCGGDCQHCGKRCR